MDEIQPESNQPEVPGTSLLSRMSHILKTGELSDVTFLVGADGTKIKAHKLVLSMMSPVFKELLERNKKTKEIDLPNIKSKAFELMLRHVYTDATDMIDCIQDAYDLYTVAKEYQFEILKDTCADYMAENISHKTALKTFEFARTNGEEALMKAALEYCCISIKAVLDDMSLLDAEMDTLTTLFGQQCMNIDSELELVEALCKIMRERKLQKTDVRAPVRCIRFRLLSPQQIAESKAIHAILTQTDLLSLITNTISENSASKMTEDLNGTKTPRDKFPPLPASTE